jgi:hypothetical protein
MFILSIESSPGSVEGSGCTQLTPELEILGKSTQSIQSKHHKVPYNTAFDTSERIL